MGQELKFYDEGHVYEYQGQIIPSVSEILRFLSREVYGNIDKFILDNAATRGTAVHSATQALDETGAVDCPSDISGYVEAYARFRREHDADWAYIEKAIAHPAMLYAGTVDRSGQLDGRFSVLDIKTTGVVKKSLVKAQLNGYKLLMEQLGETVERLYCLQLMRNGRYRLYPVAKDTTEFMACYSLHAASNKVHGRGKIE